MTQPRGTRRRPPPTQKNLYNLIDKKKFEKKRRN